ncbi:hypothetical protein CC78DRAFT_12065 [Lojkania enalia]|uniref:Uncharacterized protein n=1 Tax=Lojkania enalia TaxID=147567 RepID=A0A9P4NDI6_9PLEO|nr:hypothetical protein CC78DRAFT_12065 [Didymosphaeria enalia]
MGVEDAERVLCSIRNHVIVIRMAPGTINYWRRLPSAEEHHRGIAPIAATVGCGPMARGVQADRKQRSSQVGGAVQYSSGFDASQNAMDQTGKKRHRERAKVAGPSDKPWRPRLTATEAGRQRDG